MSRIFFKRSPDGYRNTRGEHVIHLQRGLVDRSPLKPGIDGDFGKQTEDAIKAWQVQKGEPPSGQISAADWTALTNLPTPSLFLRCISLTAQFEGHGYTFAAGNWDNAYLTWGIVGFTLKGGNLGAVLKAMDRAVIDSVMGAEKAAELMRIVDASKEEQLAWAESISVLPKKYTIRADWSDAFRALGQHPDARRAQHKIAWDVYWAQAMRDLKKYGRRTELDAALFFDTAVQNGSVGDKGMKLRQALEALGTDADDTARLKCMADSIADQSNPRFVEDVRSRRGTIAAGAGDVHGAKYQLECWGLVAGAPVTDADLTTM